MDDALELVKSVLAEAGISAGQIALLASIDTKVDEAAVLAVASHLGVRTIFFPAARLEKETPRLANPSERVFALVGCHGVAESAALAAGGPSAVLRVPKRKSAFATAALAEAEGDIAHAIEDTMLGRERP